MYINFNTCINFKRQLKPSEEAEYCDVLKRGRSLVASSDSVKDVLIVPVSSLPQSKLNNTGVGNILSDESSSFFEFAKKYWGINEIQLLPVGQYHNDCGQYPLYSGTTMDFGNHIIDIKSVLSKGDYEKLVNNNSVTNSVNFSNVVDKNSTQEKLLKNLFKNLSGDLKSEFENFKNTNLKRLTSKSLFTVLVEKYGSSDYTTWDKLDSHLFNESIVPVSQREKRIAELFKNNEEASNYYIFKQFLAEKSMKQAKSKLNKIGLKLNGDISCGFSADEVWANPKAFLKDSTIGWGMPALDFTSVEAENLLRNKVRFYSKFFDGFRVDAAWIYCEPKITNTKTGQISTQYWGDKFLKIIEDEACKVKGDSFDVKNILYEFAAESDTYNVYNGSNLKPYLENRVKIYTSDYLSKDWGSANAYIKRGWKQDSFLLGAANHDSAEIKYTEHQAEILSEILKVSKDKLKKYGEFLNAKFAEPLKSKNYMIFFLQALGMKGQYKALREVSRNYTSKIPANFLDFYLEALTKNEAYNPMLCLEMQFVSQGLDKTNPKLFKQIRKFREILQNKNDNKKYYIIASAIVIAFIAAAGIYYLRNNPDSNQHQ